MWQQTKWQHNKNDWHIKRSLVLLKENNKNKTQKHKHKVPLLPPPAYLQNPSCWLNSKALSGGTLLTVGRIPLSLQVILCYQGQEQAHIILVAPTLQKGLQALTVWRRVEGSLGTTSQPSPCKHEAAALPGAKSHSNTALWHWQCFVSERAKEGNFNSAAVIPPMPVLLSFSNPTFEGSWAEKWIKPFQFCQKQQGKALIVQWFEMDVQPRYQQTAQGSPASERTRLTDGAGAPVL